MEEKIQISLKKWFSRNKRKLPWRDTHDPYLIWLSEIILQQTRMAQGLPYFQRFLERFPDIFQLANAGEDEVLNLWQGLGYYNRARNLHHTAKVIAFEYNGKFPETYEELKKLKGIGDYTASAISSMAFNEPQAVVDGNVYRVLSRVFGIREPVNSTKGKKVFKEKAEALLDRLNPGAFNEALMDFGAIQCQSAEPKCAICPLQENCYAFQNNLVNNLPVKAKKLKRRTRYFYYLVMSDENGIVLRQRGDNDIWRKLYDFPLYEAQNGSEGDLKGLADKFGVPQSGLYHLGQYKHVLTHQDIIANFYHLKAINIDKNKENIIFVKWEKLENYALPRLIQNFYNDFLNK